MALDNGIYTALSKQVLQFREMEVIAGNVANANTVGYKADNMMFSDHLKFQGQSRDKLAMAESRTIYRDTSEGTGMVTNNQLDFMINGSGYFQVETPAGTRFTRAGNFQVDGNGNLVNSEGYPVLDPGGGRITFQETDTSVEIKGDGTLVAGGEERGQIGVVTFDNEQALQKAGGNLYNTAQAATPVDFPRIAQGVLEGSNVQPVQQITKMIMTMRRVGDTSQMIDSSYDLQRKAISVLAKRQA